MKVKDLIESLLKLDPELRVFTRGYEGGYNDPQDTHFFEAEFVENVNDWCYYGPHQIITEYAYNTYEGKPRIKGIVL